MDRNPISERPSVVVLDPRGAVPQYDAALCAALRRIPLQTWLVSSPEAIECLQRVDPTSSPSQCPYFCLEFNGGASNLGPYVKGWTRTTRLLRSERPDVIHVQWLAKPELEVRIVRSVARVARARLVYTAHNELPHDTPPDPAYRRTMGRFLAACHRVIVHTEDSRRRVLELWPQLASETVCAIPHGNYSDFSRHVTRDDARRRLRLPSDEPVVGFIGKIRPYKGLLDLIEALRMLNSEVRAHLLIAGRPDDGHYFELVQSALAVEPTIPATVIARYLSNEELEACFAAVDIVALPYTRIAQSGILMYAMTMGVCVVASSLPAFRSVLPDGEGALYFEPGDVEALSRTLGRAVSDRELRTSQARRAAETASSYSWNRIAELTRAVYDA